MSGSLGTRCLKNNFLSSSLTFSLCEDKAKITAPNPDLSLDLGDGGAHKIYLTAATPSGSVCTKKRLNWVCTEAAGKSDPEDIADEIHSVLAGDPPCEPPDGLPDGSGWTLMAGTTDGECDEQAELMELALKNVGSQCTDKTGPGIYGLWIWKLPQL